MKPRERNKREKKGEGGEETNRRRSVTKDKGWREKKGVAEKTGERGRRREGRRKAVVGQGEEEGEKKDKREDDIGDDLSGVSPMSMLCPGPRRPDQLPHMYKPPNFPSEFRSPFDFLVLGQRISQNKERKPVSGLQVP